MRLLYRNFARQWCIDLTSTATTTTRQIFEPPPTMGDTRVLCVFDSQTDFSHSLLSALVPARENRLGANTILTLAHNAHILCIYVNNVIYCITRVRRLMWTWYIHMYTRHVGIPRNYKHNIYYYKTFYNNKLHPVIRVNDDDQTTSQLPLRKSQFLIDFFSYMWVYTADSVAKKKKNYKNTVRLRFWLWLILHNSS